MIKKALILTGNYVQDHEFIYPFYRLLEDKFEVSVGINEDSKVKGILGTDIPSNKNHPITKNIRNRSKKLQFTNYTWRS